VLIDGAMWPHHFSRSAGSPAGCQEPSEASDIDRRPARNLWETGNGTANIFPRPDRRSTGVPAHPSHSMVGSGRCSEPNLAHWPMIRSAAAADIVRGTRVGRWSSSEAEPGVRSPWRQTRWVGLSVRGWYESAPRRG
jgi:hypothetical protein